MACIVFLSFPYLIYFCKQTSVARALGAQICSFRQRFTLRFQKLESSTMESVLRACFYKLKGNSKVPYSEQATYLEETESVRMARVKVGHAAPSGFSAFL
jgi:hypothetical protein